LFKTYFAAHEVQLIAVAEVPVHVVHPVGQAMQVLAMLTNPAAQE